MKKCKRCGKTLKRIEDRQWAREYKRDWYCVNTKCLYFYRPLKVKKMTEPKLSRREVIIKGIKWLNSYLEKKGRGEPLEIYFERKDRILSEIKRYIKKEENSDWFWIFIRDEPLNDKVFLKLWTIWCKENQLFGY